MTRRVRAVVHGRVQGVGFRWSVLEAARRAGAAGWVRNRSDGTVEAEVEGDDAAVAAVLDVLRTGPAAAQVTDVEVTDVPPAGESGFGVL
ncbi:acylphosphatase [Isoptericola variabilis]|uniref:Acylphosphatase n=1 Tax=Isoptericola variabilis (strain 225) TaxID=743718 RepID=F6FUE6_ISOV2|nr:acylphosphatase [Isoptericola variabilis]AEG44274.1 Acylphosphatase [Isoptericola variabilis 225]TWH28403.1 acylphosphatase [Isoptericola variabilis J7]